MAEQSRWQPTPAIDISSHARALPRWSPDGKQIAFGADLTGGGMKNYLVSSDGGPPQELPSTGESVGDPNWSPDGKSVVFWSALAFPVGEDMWIDIVDLRTGKVSVVPGSEGLVSPHWSPNGRYLAASGHNQNLMLFDFETHKWLELANVPTAFPSWSRDGKYVHFHSFGDDAALYRVRVSDHKLERIVSLKEIRLTIGSVGPGAAWLRTIRRWCCATSEPRKFTFLICFVREPGMKSF